MASGSKHDLRKELRQELEEMRNILLNYFDVVIPQLTKDLLEYADELDIAYKSNDKTICTFSLILYLCRDFLKSNVIKKQTIQGICI